MPGWRRRVSLHMIMMACGRIWHCYRRVRANRGTSQRNEGMTERAAAANLQPGSAMGHHPSAISFNSRVLLFCHTRLQIRKVIILTTGSPARTRSFVSAPLLLPRRKRARVKKEKHQEPIYTSTPYDKEGREKSQARSSTSKIICELAPVTYLHR